jgi:hypothetical protein
MMRRVLVLVLLAMSLTACAPGTRIEVVAESSKAGERVHIVIDATDAEQGKGGPVGITYPYDIVRTTPHTHSFLLQQGVILTISIRVITLNDKPGGWVQCRFKKNGVEVGHSRTRTQVTGPNSSVVCTYKARG